MMIATWRGTFGTSGTAVVELVYLISNALMPKDELYKKNRGQAPIFKKYFPDNGACSRFLGCAGKNRGQSPGDGND
jgi:hypothetical protein